ncbi:MAG: phosphoribosyltransferase [Armatimonadota bacterium]|nr:phosphoribosyltransferase [Armatimonadota bacterium]
MLFRDRVDAGKQLAFRLRNLAERDCVVMAIPRGGVVVGFEVASAINAPLDVITPRKLGAPDQPELAIGAVSAWGAGRILDEMTVRALRVTEDYVERETRAQIAEIERRLKAYRGSTEPPDLTGKVALMIDDGIATGYTMLAAIRGVQSLGPERIVAGAPVASTDAAHRVGSEVDELVCLHTPSPFLAVGYWYTDFSQVTDEEVIQLLRRNRAGAAAAG